MQLTITNLAFAGGDAAKKLARELAEQAGVPASKESVFAKIRARANQRP